MNRYTEAHRYSHHRISVFLLSPVALTIASEQKASTEAFHYQTGASLDQVFDRRKWNKQKHGLLW